MNGMPIQPFPLDWEFHEQGDPDEWVILTEQKRWVIAFRMNGELHAVRQRAIVQLMVEAARVTHETGRTPRQLADQQRDLLVAAQDALGLLEALPASQQPDSARFQSLRDAIARAQGGAA
jgi:hypothetical protein